MINQAWETFFGGKVKSHAQRLLNRVEQIILGEVLWSRNMLWHWLS